MRILPLLISLIFFAMPLRAETPWGAADAIRSEAGRIERLLYRGQSAARDAEIKDRLQQIATSWEQAAPQFGAERDAVDSALADYDASVRADDQAAAAKSRQLLWAALMAAARVQALAAIDASDAQAASDWLTVRDYARASGDTAAALAVQALGDGTLDAAATHETVEGELLTVAASELRLAISRAKEDAAADHPTQYAGDLGRIEGLAGYLGSNLTDHLGDQGNAQLEQALARAETDPAALSDISTLIAGYSPVRLSPEEKLRRARLLRRFTALVWEEYGNGVRNGEITQPLEYYEARLFRDRAAIILGDLVPQMQDTAQGERLGALLAEMKAKMDAREDGVEPLVAEALAIIEASFGEAVVQGGYEAAVDALPATLDELQLMAQAGDWSGAELKRLEAYSWFDPDIEQRLVPRAPAMTLRIEARFWEGTAARPGLGKLIEDQLPVAEEVAGIKEDVLAARAKIETPVSPIGAALQSAGIVFREGLEAVLIIAALLAALRAEGLQPSRFRAPIAAGLVAALLFSFALWAAARWLFSLSTLAREAIEGGTALLAAAVLTWMVLGLNAGGGHVANFRAKLAGIANPWTVGSLAFLVVFREGFETVLFYEAMLVDASAGSVLIGLVGGGAAALVAGWLILASGRKLPLRLFFRITSVLLSILAVVLVGAGIRGLQTAALISATPVAWFPDRDWLQLWFGLFPVAEPLAAQALTLAILALPWLWRQLPRRSRVGRAS
ncbi:hypothetical protein FQV27_07490 [Paracoccus aurantiacus]|uniref:Iron permease n=1 Tax=Paracoccus aurantiacus TaxID=2599412 RepID=A0A5C6S865_9RHOB|nr:FTR1 family protein [Paracoccus aurantiacus]TXB69942.1 hypothetical protein FQV27_07490 [Paracoccus aurantiacus]